MALSEFSNKGDIPQPSKGLRFVKNEEGIREFKTVEIFEDTKKDTQKPIVLVGCIGTAYIDRITVEILCTLQKHDEIKGPILIVWGEAPLENVWLQLSDEQIRELGKSREFIFTKREEIMDTIFPKIRSSDFKQRQLFHLYQSPKTQRTKGMWYKKIKQRIKQEKK